MSEFGSAGGRAAGHDEQLWTRLIDLGATSMGLPQAVGGDSASLVTLVLVAEQYGAVLAPVPLISQIVAARLLAAAGAPAELLAGVVNGERPVVLAPHPASSLWPPATGARCGLGARGGRARS